MKRTRIALAIVATAIAAFGFGGASYAFHDGGVAECAGCHSMHDPLSADKLLVASDQSSTCLSCHESVGDTGPTRYHISTPSAELTLDTDIVVQRTPGGDFGWLRQNLSEPASYGGGYVYIQNWGYERGHNIIAADNDYLTPDGTNSPGGAAPSADLSCISCHDPHSRARRIDTGDVIYPNTIAPYEPIVEAGSYGHVPVAGEAVGVYRLLGGAQYQAYDPGPNFPGVPPAVVPDDYNRNEGVDQTRTSYGVPQGVLTGYSSWSNWCGTCHGQMHNTGGDQTLHPTAMGLTAATMTAYNRYVQTGDLTGTTANAYTSLVPFALDTDDPLTLTAKALIDDSDLDGPASGDEVTCFTCHRAHASGWKYALRWNGEAEFLTLADGAGAPIYPGVNAGLGNQGQFNRGYTIGQMVAAYNGRPAQTHFAAHQRSLCNKCHEKD